jgi:hypothetical protein
MLHSGFSGVARGLARDFDPAEKTDFNEYRHP